MGRILPHSEIHDFTSNPYWKILLIQLITGNTKPMHACNLITEWSHYSKVLFILDTLEVTKTYTDT